MHDEKNELVAVAIIVFGLDYALIQCGIAFTPPEQHDSAYRRFRNLSARIPLIGLETTAELCGALPGSADSFRRTADPPPVWQRQPARRTPAALIASSRFRNTPSAR
jgi:hypothetical protein